MVQCGHFIGAKCALSSDELQKKICYISAKINRSGGSLPRLPNFGQESCPIRSQLLYVI
jgi:hypothetical protein